MLISVSRSRAGRSLETRLDRFWLPIVLAAVAKSSIGKLLRSRSGTMRWAKAEPWDLLASPTSGSEVRTRPRKTLAPEVHTDASRTRVLQTWKPRKPDPTSSRLVRLETPT
jgi:hypothetical protein